MSALVPKKQIRPRQATVLSAYCEQRKWDYEVIRDHSEGLNYNKKGLLKLLTLIVSREVRRLVITHKERFLRFGAELFFSLCEIFNTEVIIINRSIRRSPEEDLAQDVLEIITVFSARLYGLRSHQNKVLVDELEKTAKRIQENSGIDTQSSV